MQQEFWMTGYAHELRARCVMWMKTCILRLRKGNSLITTQVFGHLCTTQLVKKHTQAPSYRPFLSLESATDHMDRVKWALAANLWKAWWAWDFVGGISGTWKHVAFPSWKCQIFVKATDGFWKESFGGSFLPTLRDPWKDIFGCLWEVLGVNGHVWHRRCYQRLSWKAAN